MSYETVIIPKEFHEPMSMGNEIRQGIYELIAAITGRSCETDNLHRFVKDISFQLDLLKSYSRFRAEHSIWEEWNERKEVTFCGSDYTCIGRLEDSIEACNVSITITRMEIISFCSSKESELDYSDLYNRLSTLEDSYYELATYTWALDHYSEIKPSEE